MRGLPLRQREIEILEGAARGEDWRATGARLHLSPETVRSLRKEAIAKLAARNLTHAVVLTVGLGLVSAGDVLEEHTKGEA